MRTCSRRLPTRRPFPPSVTTGNELRRHDSAYDGTADMVSFLGIMAGGEEMVTAGKQRMAMGTWTRLAYGLQRRRFGDGDGICILYRLGWRRRDRLLCLSPGWAGWVRDGVWATDKGGTVQGKAMTLGSKRRTWPCRD